MARKILHGTTRADAPRRDDGPKMSERDRQTSLGGGAKPFRNGRKDGPSLDERKLDAFAKGKLRV